MTHQLRYGKTSTLQMEFPPETLVADFTSVPGQALDDTAAAVAAALADPIGFPALAKSVVPGDRVAIAVEPGVPRSPEIVAGVIHTLLDANIRAADIIVLVTSETGLKADLQRLLPAADNTTIVVHDATDRNELAYLAASKDAKPIYLNCQLCEADVIVPISAMRPESSFGYSGLHGGLYPTFSDEAARKRFRAPKSAIELSQLRHRRAEADEVAWLLGLQLIVQVIPGSGNTVLHVLAGLADAVAERGRELVDAAWSYRVPKKADLVVAAIEGDNDEQNWENFGRALYAASQVCSEQGSIILCTELKCKPGPALRRLAGFDDEEKLVQRIGKERSEDAVPASLLLHVRDRQHVFLLSGLDAGAVESIGIGCITDPQQIDHLARKSSSCILLADAHRAAPKPEESD